MTATGAVRPLKAVVVGDMTIDWHLIRAGARPSSADASGVELPMRVVGKPGGVGLLGQVIERAATSCPPTAPWTIELPPDPGSLVRPTNRHFNHAFALWERHPTTIGAMFVRTRGNEPPFQFADAEIDRLSRDEHLRWYKSKLADGWRYGPERDNDNLVHPAPLPWPVGEAAVQYTTDELGRIGTSYPSTRRRRTAPRCAASPRSSTGPATRSSAARSERRPPPRGQPAMLTPNSLPMP